MTGNVSTALATTKTAVPNVPKRLSTPARLRLYVVLVWVLTALIFAVGETTLIPARAANKTIGKEAAPSIIAAQEINGNLADLDANAANYLLGNKAQRDAATAAFEERRTKVTQRMVDAAANITYGDEERRPVNELFASFGRYLEFATESRLRHDAGDDKGALRAYGTATELMHTRLLPAGDELDAANKKYLDAAYKNAVKQNEGAEVAIGLIGILLLGVLLHAQWFLIRRTRRLFNLPVLAASAVAFGFMIYLVSAIIGARADLKLAKEDAFDSMHWLSHARAVALDANGDESRWLLDPSRQRFYDESWSRKVSELTSAPMPPASARADWKRGRVTFTGLFAKELSNITFEGEFDAAVAMVDTFASYDEADVRMRKLEREGSHAAAIEVGIGMRPNDANPLFDRFDAALTKVVQINRTAFDKAIQEGDASLSHAEWIDPIAAIAIALLVALGLRTRLREYAA